MRKNLLLTCLFAGTALSSCIRADLNECQGHQPEEEDKQIIYFRYTGDGTNDLLADKIKFADLYRARKPRDGIHHFYSLLHEVLDSMEGGGTFAEKADLVYFRLEEKLTQLDVCSVCFEERMRRICRDTPIEMDEYNETINQVVEKHSADLICKPMAIYALIESSHCRRPILIHGSHYLLKYLVNSDTITYQSRSGTIPMRNSACS